MKRIILALLMVSLVAGPSSAFAGKREPVEPTGKAREIQYTKAVAWCRNKFGGAYGHYGLIVAHWQKKWGQAGWYCSF